VQVTELPNTGVYSDTATNGTTYFYKLEAVNSTAHRSAIIDAGRANAPSQDPIPPQAVVIINDGATHTASLNVKLNFAPYHSETFTVQQTFGDITQLKISNEPTLAGASYQPFAQNVPWTLLSPPQGQAGRVYVQFKDANGNESTIEVGAILISGISDSAGRIYLPLVRK
jgi:hypothetical protein